MEVIPCIDLRGGRCVRLYQGDFQKETAFSADPLGMARHWEGLGAPRLHIVDLDGARLGEPVHTGLIADMAKAVKIPLQVGGGVRRLGTVEALLNLGVGRVVLGTAAVSDPELVVEACRRFGERIVVSIDARNGLVATRGWQEASALTAGELLARMAALGVRRFIYTDIARDGTLQGPDYEALRGLLSQTPLPVIASGGVASLEHLRRLAELGVEGALVGRALYNGEIELREALAEVG